MTDPVEPNDPKNPVTPPVTPDPPVQTPDSSQTPPAGYVKEDAYKGLQAVVSKKDKEIADLKTQVTTLTSSLEEYKAKETALTGTQKDINDKLSKSDADLKSAQDQVTKLTSKTNLLEIALKEYPDLGSVLDFIPPADTPEQFRINATNLRNAMSQYSHNVAKKNISGATPPGGDGNLTPPGEDEGEKLYKETILFAGVSGKEAEFRDSNKRYQDYLTAKGKK